MASNGNLGFATMLAALLACVPERVAQDPASLAGCYAFEPETLLAEPLGHQMPDTMFFDSATYLNPDGRTNPLVERRLEVVATRPNAGIDSLRLDSANVVPWPPGWDYYALTGWSFVAPDSVKALLHANMNESWRLLLRARRDSLVGVAQRYSDYLSGHPTIPVRAHRIACRALSGAAI